MSTLLKISAHGSGNPLHVHTATKVVDYILSLKNEEKFLRTIVGDLKDVEVDVVPSGVSTLMMVSCACI